MVKTLLIRILTSIILIPLSLFFIIKGSYYFNIFILIVLFFSLREWSFVKQKKVFYFIGLIFLFFSFYTVYELRNLNNNYFFFLLTLSICIATDVGGYVFGNLFKGPKLTGISPNKTYTGVIGSYFFSILIVSLVSYKSYYFFNDIQISVNLIIFTILISTISQLGDLTISYFKRLFKIKDTGKIIPGHGGILDRIDGMIFAFPVSYIILSTNLFTITK